MTTSEFNALVTADVKRLIRQGEEKAIANSEPDCTCHQSDVDLFDPSGCEYHDSESNWNMARRAASASEDYDRAMEEAHEYFASKQDPWFDRSEE